MSFAALETRLNASVHKHMANARVSLGGGDVDVIFKNPSASSTGGVGMATTEPSIELPTASVPADPIGMTFLHAGHTWEIVDQNPDGAGWSVLILEQKS